MNTSRQMNAFRTITGAAVLGALVALAPGCGPSNKLPMNTQLLASGSTVDGTAPGDGMAYVYDKNSAKVLYTGRVMKGDRISVQPDKKTIQLNGNVVEHRTMNLGDEYEVRFMSQPES